MRQQAGEAETPDPTSDEVAEQDSSAVDIANDDLGQTGATWGQGNTSSQTGVAGGLGIRRSVARPRPAGNPARSAKPGGRGPH